MDTSPHHAPWGTGCGRAQFSLREISAYAPLRHRKSSFLRGVVVTANRLSDGKVLYRAADEGWTTRLEAAAVVTTTEAARELLPAAVREDTEAVDAYAAPVAICDGCIEPRNLRERIRAAGRHSRCQQRGNRIAIPCGTLSSAQLHTFARIARKYDRKYSHFTT
jgi:hypothetical protein